MLAIILPIKSEQLNFCHSNGCSTVSLQWECLFFSKHHPSSVLKCLTVKQCSFHVMKMRHAKNSMLRSLITMITIPSPRNSIYTVIRDTYWDFQAPYSLLVLLLKSLIFSIYFRLIHRWGYFSLFG